MKKRSFLISVAAAATVIGSQSVTANTSELEKTIDQAKVSQSLEMIDNSPESNGTLLMLPIQNSVIENSTLAHSSHASHGSHGSHGSHSSHSSGY